MRHVKELCCCLVLVEAFFPSLAQTGEWINTKTYQTTYDYEGNWKDGYVPLQDGDSATFPTAVESHGSRNIILPSQSLHLSSLSGLGCQVLVLSSPVTLGIDVPNAFYGTLNAAYEATALNGTTDRTSFPVLTKHESGNWSASFNYLTARVGWDVRVPDAGTSAEIGYFSGPRLRKTGAGVLAVGGFSDFDCRVDVRAGTLRLSGRTAGGLPAGAFFHVDASDLTTMTIVEQDGVKRVTEWRDADGGTNKAGPSGSRPCPVLRENALNGLSVLDFGAQGGTTRTPSDEEIALLGRPSALGWSERSEEIREAFIVLCDVTNAIMAYAIGDTAGYDFAPGQQDGNGLRTPFYRPEAAVSVLDGDIRIDGVKCPQGNKHSFIEWKVLSVGVNGTARAGAFALDRAGYRVGGCRIAEALFYTNALTVAERSAVNAYLAGKWFSNVGRYDVDAGTVAMSAGTSLDVPAGHAAHVGRLIGTGTPIVKTGAGTLVIDAVSGPDGLSQVIDVQEGEVRFERLVPVQAAGAAPGAWMHLDAAAADTSRWTFESQGGTNFVAVWADVRTDSTRTASALGHTGRRPYLVADGCNGLPVVDFGSYGSAEAGWLRFAEDDETPVQEVFLVVRDSSPTLYSFFLGAAKSVSGEAAGVGDSVPFHRGANGALLNGLYANTYAVNGDWTVDGRPVDPTAAGVLDGAFHVIRFSGARGLHAGLFGNDRNTSERFGGFQMGEALVYDRRLTEAERRATEAYLLEKWLGRAHPLATNDSTVIYPASAEIETTTEAEVGKVLGAGSFVKTGVGSLSLGYLEPTFDSLSVEGGVLNVKDGFAGALQKAFYHADASAAGTLKTSDDGTSVRVKQWRDADGGSVFSSVNSRCPKAPTLLANATNGLPVLDFGPFMQSKSSTDYHAEGESSAMSWSQGSTSIREVHLIVGDRPGDSGEFLLGGTDTYHFHRGGNAQLLYAGENLVPKQLLNGYIALDGIPVTYKTALPSGLHLVSFAVTNETADGVSAGGFSFDRKYRYGGLRLGEAMIFNELLTEGERAAVQDSLMRKWFAKSPIVRGLSSLRVAAGAELSVSWPTALSEGAELGVAFAGGRVASVVSLEGALSAAGAGTVRISSDGVKPKAGDYEIAVAHGGIDAASAMRFAISWQVVCPWTDAFADIKLVVADGRLFVRFVPKGLVITVR